MHNNDVVGSDAMDVEVDDDRLSNLPDAVIHKILSSVSIKDVIATSLFSSRWRFIWTSMPDLNFENLNHGPQFSKFITNVLSHRNNQVQVSSVNLVLGTSVIDNASVRRILKCASSHNVQQLTVTRENLKRSKNLPASYSYNPILGCSYSFIAAPKWDLPALTTLHLHHIQLSDDSDTTTGLFSKCPNLKNLFLRRCSMKGTKVLNICHPLLTNLTLEYTPPDLELEEVVNVVAPQLKNLTMKLCFGKHMITAPGLTSLVMEGPQPWQLSTPVDFHSLEKAELFMHDAYDEDAHEIVCLLQQLHSVKLLILNVGLLMRLISKSKYVFSRAEPLSTLDPHKAGAFAKAKITKFTTTMPVNVYLEVEALSRPTEIKNYDHKFPSAIFPMVSEEELTTMWDMALAQVFVNQLGQLVKQCKANTNSDANEQGKPQVEMDRAWKLQSNLGEMLAVVLHREIVALETCQIMALIRHRYIERPVTHPIIAWLEEIRALFERIERMITQMSASKRVAMQTNFIRLCEDAAILTNNLLGWMKTAK